MTRTYLLATVTVFCLTGTIGIGGAFAQTAQITPLPPTPTVSQPALSPTEAVLQAQLDAKGPTSHAGADETDEIYKRYIAELGRPMTHGTVGTTSNTGTH